MLFENRFEGCRQHQRVELKLPGRFMLRDRCERPCWTIDVSPNGLAVESDEKGQIGDPVVAYINQLGRIEGVLVRQFQKGFAVKALAPAAKTEKLAAQIAWLAQRQMFGAPGDLRRERLAPDGGRTTLTTPDGVEYVATVIDISSHGAAINVETAPPIGSPVTIGQTRARVVRHFAGGIGVTFQGLSRTRIGASDAVDGGLGVYPSGSSQALIGQVGSTPERAARRAA